MARCPYFLDVSWRPETVDDEDELVEALQGAVRKAYDSEGYGGGMSAIGFDFKSKRQAEHAAERVITYFERAGFDEEDYAVQIFLDDRVISFGSRRGDPISLSS